MADRVIVLSERPAKIKQIEKISIPNYNSPLKARNDPKFTVHFQNVWKVINDE